MTQKQQLRMLRKHRAACLSLYSALSVHIVALEKGAEKTPASKKAAAVAKGRRGYTRSKEVAGVKGAASRSSKAAK